MNTSTEHAMENVATVPKIVNETIEKHISFSRADKGLGLSIAGGLGSTPFKVNTLDKFRGLNFISKWRSFGTFINRGRKVVLT